MLDKNAEMWYNIEIGGGRSSASRKKVGWYLYHPIDYYSVTQFALKCSWKAFLNSLSSTEDI